MLYLLSKKTLLEQMFSKSEEKSKKLVLVSATSTLVTETREEAVETAEATDKDGERSKSKYPENFV